ncbi:NADPH-dependent FMN reductase [Caballeronia terrestris]|uniref:NADPH-dependent FMN reductase n=1 Tax=Caballeronia terrestris TaxID=1226301 RepID=A0A158KLK6_9BURK|nr:NADPH-dependent FMN reductase [Caballeronia terrestris]SAL81450.1 NADPH-dependent FMN reductase [Caballeronia terrestris]
MSYVVTLSGSPAARSRSTHLLGLAETALRVHGAAVRRIDARELPAVALMHADFGDAAVRRAVELVEHAQAVIIATPLYKASYSGLLKSFLDMLPQRALAHKPVLPFATGGSLAHLLALDYALKPVLASLGARHVLENVFATERDMPVVDGTYAVTDAIADRLAEAIESLVRALDDAAALRSLRDGRRMSNERPTREADLFVR